MEEEEKRALSSVTLRPNGEGLEVSIPRLRMLPLALQRRVTHRILKRYAGEAAGFDHVETLLALVRDSAGEGPGTWGGEKRVSLPGGIAAVFKRETLGFLPDEATEPPDVESMRNGLEIQVPGSMELVPWGIRLETALSSREECPPLPSSTLEAQLDLDLTGTAFSVRSRRPGDRFHPLGLGGTQKIQDFLVNVRIPRRLRDRVPLLVTGAGEIAWIIGHRIDDRFKVQPGTKRVLRLKAIPLVRPTKPPAEN